MRTSMKKEMYFTVGKGTRTADLKLVFNEEVS
jgi:hypothetical protein